MTRPSVVSSPSEVENLAPRHAAPLLPAFRRLSSVTAVNPGRLRWREGGSTTRLERLTAQSRIKYPRFRRFFSRSV